MTVTAGDRNAYLCFYKEKAWMPTSAGMTGGDAGMPTSAGRADGDNRKVNGKAGWH